MAVAPQSPRRYLRVRTSLHHLHEVAVVYGAMSAIRGEDGRTYVSADLCCAECARSARTTLVLQRRRAAIPAHMPAPHHLAATRDVVARCERGEAVTS